jgi:hypothetical protein
VSWRVVGQHAVLGVQPGDVIEQDIPALQAAQLAAGGHIAEVTGDEPRSASEQEAPSPAADNPQEGD